MSNSAVLSPPPHIRAIQSAERPIREEVSQLEELETQYRGLILETGEDTEREGLQKTPERAAKAWRFLTSGYDRNPLEIVKSALFEEDHRDMVLVKDIDFYSLCEHHLLPFFGTVHVAYIPDGRIVGLSKIPRLVDALARRLQVQERLTKQIAETLSEALSPRGIAVWVDASHMCMMMRGVEKQQSVTTTSVFRGEFENNMEIRDLFMSGLSKAR